MPTSKNLRKGGQERNRKGRLAERSSSFHGKSSVTGDAMLPRPRTVPNLASGRTSVAVAVAAVELMPKLTKLLLNVTIQRSLGAVQVFMSPEATVGDLIAAALQLYGKESRRPVLPSTDPSSFDLHYSQFSLESLDREEKLMALGSRNFFLWPKSNRSAAESDGDGLKKMPSSSSCSKQADKATTVGHPWLKFFMGFSLKL